MESYLPRMYKLVGTNGLRRIEFTMYVEARSASEAVRKADRERERRGLVRAEHWRTTPAN